MLPVDGQAEPVWRGGLSIDQQSRLAQSLSQYAPKSDVAGAGVDRLRIAGGGAVALAVFFCAQMRSTFHHFARDADWGGFVKTAPA